MALRDLMSRLLAAILLCGTAARGEAMQPLIERPVSLPAGKVDLTLHGTYTHWTGGVLGGIGGTTLTGETLSFGVDVGVRDNVQLGLAVALPIHPGAGFGSVVGRRPQHGLPRHARADGVAAPSASEPIAGPAP